MRQLSSRFDRQEYKLRGSSSVTVRKSSPYEDECKHYSPDHEPDVDDMYCNDVYAACCIPTETDENAHKYKDLCEWLGFEDLIAIDVDAPRSFSTYDTIDCAKEDKAMDDAIEDETTTTEATEGAEATTTAAPPLGGSLEVSSSRSMRIFAFVCARLASRFDASIIFSRDPFHQRQEYALRGSSSAVASFDMAPHAASAAL